ncbi:LLM class flavin-dependent oxidoreductase [Naumannella halotolerans]|nr:LLM class flavin-dependent oxidoreductase [Naumannella halotolerans]
MVDHVPTRLGTTRFHWFLPTRGDASTPGVVPAFRSGPRAGAREADLSYLTEVAQAAERGGFHSALTPVGIGCPDPWVVCSAIAARTERLGFIVALRPSLSSATLLAQQADTFRKLHGDRIILNVVTGGDPAEQAAYGSHVAHDERYEITDEVLQALTPLLQGERVDLQGRHLRLVGAQLVAPAGAPVPIFFGGASDAALEVAAKAADSYLLWAEPPAELAPRIARVRELAGERPIGFGLRVHVISRDTAEEAWQVAAQMQAGFAPEVVAKVQQRLQAMDSVGQARMRGLRSTDVPADVADLTIAPNLWTGIGLVREGVGTAIVGSHDQVVDRLVEYADLGIDEFILSGYPHREEAARVGAEVLPRFAARRAAMVRTNRLVAGF